MISSSSVHIVYHFEISAAIHATSIILNTALPARPFVDKSTHVTIKLILDWMIQVFASATTAGLLPSGRAFSLDQKEERKKKNFIKARISLEKWHFNLKHSPLLWIIHSIPSFKSLLYEFGYTAAIWFFGSLHLELNFRIFFV